jgi:CSLREA domain-containing protein
MTSPSLSKGAFTCALLLGLGAPQARAAVFQVTFTGDSGAGSLREAIIASNAAPDSDTIIFAPRLKGTIKLTSGEMVISGKVRIQGPGEGIISISGNRSGRIFNVVPTGNASIEGLTIGQGWVRGVAGGEARGGAILNSGKLALTRVTLSGNYAIGSQGVGYHLPGFKGGGNARGGAICNLGFLSVNLVTWKNNASIGGPGGYGRPSRSGDLYRGGNGGSAWGGALYNGGTLKDNDSTYLSNRVVAGAPGSFNYGGAGLATGPDVHDVLPAINAAAFTGTLNYPFAAHLTATGDNLTYILASGTLPPGLTLDPTTGEFKGLPTTALTSQTVTVKVSDSIRESKAIAITFKIKAKPEKALVVTTAADVVNPADGHTSLREALQLANLNPDLNTITFKLSGEEMQTAALTAPHETGAAAAAVITTPISLVGRKNSELALKTGSGLRLFDVTGTGKLTLSDLTIAGSGGIDNQGTLKVNDCVFTGNKRNALSSSGTAEITATAFNGNYGSGVSNAGQMKMTGCTIAGNDGRGIANTGNLTVAGTSITGNIAGRSANGGGIWNGGELNITGSAITGNTCDFMGAGIYSEKVARISNCTIADNINTSSSNFAGGGGIANSTSGADATGKMEIDSCTIVGNTSVFGAGVFNLSNTSTVISNSIIAGNSGILGAATYDIEPSPLFNEGEFISKGSNLIGSVIPDGVFNQPGDRTRMSLEDLKLGELSGSGKAVPTIELLPGSPAIDKGQTSLKTDARGLSRPPGKGDDIGAFEKDPASPRKDNDSIPSSSLL